MQTDQALNILENYKLSRQTTIIDWSIETKSENIVESGWYKDHKGEVVLKISINLKTQPAQVNVLQKVKWLYFFSKESSETEWAVNTRKLIVEIIKNTKSYKLKAKNNK